jgi:hypothetical protein
MLTQAIAMALRGERTQAAGVFDELIALFEPIVLGFDLTMVRATYAMLVGRDHPAAVEAARDAHEWLVRTGSHGLMRMWAGGLPTATDSEATA